MVLVMFVVAGLIAAGTVVDPFQLFYASIGLILIAASGNAMNMYLERYTDFLMPRTSGRPLPAQRLSATEVVTFAAICFGISVGVFAALVNWQTTACAVATWFMYVWIYTPLKRKTWLNTEVGTIPGAMPIIMASLATTGTVNAVIVMFFAVLIFWQIPHFMAIAWMYRKEYRDSGLQMLTVVDPTGVRAGRKAVVTCALMVAASLLPAITFRTLWHVWLFVIVALALGVLYLSCSIRFRLDRTDRSARRLLLSSIIYLPLYMLTLVVARFS
jgi:protoheme IX farnesyltransferase